MPNLSSDHIVFFFFCSGVGGGDEGGGGYSAFWERIHSKNTNLHFLFFLLNIYVGEHKTVMALRVLNRVSSTSNILNSYFKIRDKLCVFPLSSSRWMTLAPPPPAFWGTCEATHLLMCKFINSVYPL